VAGGATAVQLRLKDAPTEAVIEAGRAVKTALAGSGALFVVNDDVAAAAALGADGVHVGQGDLSPAEARAAIGPGRLLGLSVETEAQAAAADPTLVDHVGAGPVFATGSKADHAPPVGMDGLAAMARAARVPAVAIGGLSAATAGEAMRAGAAGVAVVSAICAAADPEAAAREIARAVREARA
ncbi:MAG: thiamine phosphate synthase, partial [Paracoccaceae bacterium]